MALSAKRRILLAKVESVYGTDPVPTGSNALVVTALDVSPMETQTVDRNLIRPYFGQSEKLMTENHAKATFEIELAAHAAGVIGKVPATDCLIRACGFAATQLTRSITGITRSSTVATATTSTSHSYVVGNTVSISGANETDYNGEFVIATVPSSTTFTYAVANSPSSPATGTIVMKSGYSYAPISTAIPSVTLYYGVDGVLHKLTGCKGTFSLDIQTKNVPKFKFEFTGITNDPTDTANATPDFSSFMIPQVANTTNTTAYSLLGYSGNLEQLSFALNNQVTYVSLIGTQYADILDRKISGSMSFEAPTIAAKDYWSAAKNQTTGTMAVTHGSANGNKVAFSFPRVMLDSPKYKDLNNVMMVTCGVSIMPNTGNDEMTMIFQ